MTREYRVAFEASAAIGVEIQVEADDEDQAEEIAQKMVDSGQLKLTDITVDLLYPSELEISAYAEQENLPITHVMFEEDENGFEIVDVFEKEKIDG